MFLSSIAAINQADVIGHGSQLPWHCPEDLANFKRVTNEHILIMGNRTFEGLPRRLRNRHIAVLSTKPQPRDQRNGIRYFSDIVSLFHGLNDWNLELPNAKIFVAGGAQTYQQLEPYISELHLTYIRQKNPLHSHATFFPIPWKQNFSICHCSRLGPGIFYFILNKIK